MRVGIDRRAVAEISDRHEIASEVTAEQLAHVRASAQAVIARAALRGPRHADSIADLDSPHLRTDRFNDAHTAMTLDERHIVRVGSGQAGVAQRVAVPLRAESAESPERRRRSSSTGCRPRCGRRPADQ